LGRRYEWWGDRQDFWHRAWLALNYSLGALAAVIAGVAGTSVLSSEEHAQFAGILALVSASLGALLTFLNPAARAGRASKRAISCWEVAMLARYQIATELPHANLDRAKKLLTQMQERERAALNLGGNDR
jgi:hypothetical protein